MHYFMHGPLIHETFGGEIFVFVHGNIIFMRENVISMHGNFIFMHEIFRTSVTPGLGFV